MTPSDVGHGSPYRSSEWDYLGPDNHGVAPAAMPPSLSLVITAYQVAAYLPSTLASVFSQTRPPDEVIVCDDGSTDDVAGAIAPWRDSIVLVRRRQGGEGAAKNTALQAATCDVVVNLDGDDTMHSQRLEAISWVLQKRPDVDILTSEFDQFGPGAVGPAWRMANRFPIANQRTTILEWNFLPAPAIRRSALLAVGGYREDLRYGPDWECYIRMILGGAKAAMLLEPLYRYRRWAGQQTADQGRVLKGRIQVLAAAAEFRTLSAGESQVIAASMARARFDLTRWELSQGGFRRRSAARAALSRALPWRQRAWAAGALLIPPLARAIDEGRGRRGAPPPVIPSPRPHE